MSDIESGVSVNRFKNQFTINRFLKTIFHGLSFVLFVFVLLFGCKIWLMMDESLMVHPLLKDLKMLTPFFFTNWNFVFQTIFLGLSLTHDVLEWLDKEENNVAQKLKYWRDVCFCGMVVPCTLFVTTMFWCVYAIDRELVFPQVYDEVVPWWFNHCVHTNITIVLLIETLLQSRRKPTDVKMELILYWIVAVAYAIVYYSIYFATNRWLYQVFGTMNWWQVCLYQLSIWGMMYIFYRLQFPINRIFHREEISENTAVDMLKDQNDTTNKVDDNSLSNGNDNVRAPNNGKIITDLKTPPFSTKSWSLKFRSIRSQFENSRL